MCGLYIVETKLISCPKKIHYRNTYIIIKSILIEKKIKQEVKFLRAKKEIKLKNQEFASFGLKKAKKKPIAST